MFALHLFPVRKSKWEACYKQVDCPDKWIVEAGLRMKAMRTVAVALMAAAPFVTNPLYPQGI